MAGVDFKPGLVRFARKALGLKQAELALALGVDALTVCRWETGPRPIQRETQLAVANLLALYERDATAFQRMLEDPPPLSANG
ncbi:MAG: helix-turn-helix transcriptional regulator [Hydrocarboniphaga effusa]|nr:helix-turn-helix transcriptional regulator [Hydrocarboniphaga effusa]